MQASIPNSANPNLASSNSAPAADLSQLKDIHLPEAIHDWPIAFGWWILLVLIVLGITTGIYLLQRYKAKNANKKAALKVLEHQFNQYKTDKNAQSFLLATNQTLKRYCLKAYPNAVSLSGTSWTDFLIHRYKKHNKADTFSEEIINALSQGIYQSNCQFDANKLYKTSVAWLKNNKPAAEANADNASKGHSND